MVRATFHAAGILFVKFPFSPRLFPPIMHHFARARGRPVSATFENSLLLPIPLLSRCLNIKPLRLSGKYADSETSTVIAVPTA